MESIYIRHIISLISPCMLIWCLIPDGRSIAAIAARMGYCVPVRWGVSEGGWGVGWRMLRWRGFGGRGGELWWRSLLFVLLWWNLCCGYRWDNSKQAQCFSFEFSVCEHTNLPTDKSMSSWVGGRFCLSALELPPKLHPRTHTFPLAHLLSDLSGNAILLPPIPIYCLPHHYYQSLFVLPR